MNAEEQGLPAIDITVQAGDWPDEAAVHELVEPAVAAAIAALSTFRAPRNLSPSPSPKGGGEFSRARLKSGSELSILFTDDEAIRRLNAQYRGNDNPTNVLSFPQASGLLLGDIVLAYETVRDEAALAEKPLKAHMAHLIVHGFLHLIGYDHESEEEAAEMEALERAALRLMDIADPYAAAQEL